jgi:hypothetical protein
MCVGIALKEEVVALFGQQQRYTDAIINSVSSLPSPAAFNRKSRKNFPHGYFGSGAMFFL